MNRLQIAYHTVIDRKERHWHEAEWRNRCGYCGHRVTVNGVAPIETRKQLYRLPAEIVGRYRAMRHGHTIPAVFLDD